MRVILTHEQADFDAIAALLGAWLVSESDVPVQPRRCNRNVSAFLTLYGADLPFVDPRDLPGEPIEAVLVVDTQYPITLKGMGADTLLKVIDHHPQRSDAPATWQTHIEVLGATTTLFVETLQESGAVFSPLHATLMLLGIYEDTGALTFSATTPRDVRAAAYLLEQGASLSILAQYLNPPLSPDQRRVYDRLLASAETLQINSQKIVIACGCADDMHEEVSSVAHKLRDLLEPDALFLFVTTSEGVRLVARSSTPRINVNEVSAVFGGGGHDRAAAALIRVEAGGGPDKEQLLAECCQKLKTLLPGMVKPSISVSQMMSRRPRLITPQTSAQEAAELMQRYGYEGYPVVSDHKVVGLLTRRAVDRAISHRLNLKASSLMEAGEVTVFPTDSVEHLQQVMIASGWGQIPVVLPETGEIVGIVTRTDLIKTLSLPTHLDLRQNLAWKLEQALPPGRLAFLRLVAEEAFALHNAVYIVGGFVRDLLLDRPSQDLDIVVEGDAIQLARGLQKRYGGEVVSHSRFGTAKWSIGAIRADLASRLDLPSASPADLPEKLDLISARTEFYERPTALPTVERSGIKLDLHRRDFTINTMALRLDGRHYGELYDYWGGLNDLKHGLVRVLHSLSFIEDPTRLLRAVRFEQRFGFQIEQRTLQLVGEAGAMLKQVSGDRIRHELELILSEGRVGQMLPRLAELGILAAIHADLPSQIPAAPLGEAPPPWHLEARYAGLPTSLVLAYLVWLAPLTRPQIESLAGRLHFSAALTGYMEKSFDVRSELEMLLKATSAQIADVLDAYPPVVLYTAHQICPDPAIRQILETYVSVWQQVHPSASGDTLRQMGIPPGPQYRTILRALRHAWLDGEITHADQEQAFIQSILERG
ncbi:MAG TPA: CBS domain-containing protein [Anaerolineaceae bacterium]